MEIYFMTRIDNSWLIGTNWSGFREMRILEKILLSNKVDFVEILIDNFLLVNPIEIKDFLGGLPCSFHIMNSQFIHRNKDELLAFVKTINSLSDKLCPIYISDHLGYFYLDDMPLLAMEEIDYQNKDEIEQRVEFYKNHLNSNLLLENYPSIFSRGVNQQEFFTKIIKNCDIQLLFDISNSIVAENNKILQSREWLHILNNVKHFHIAGYDWSTTIPQLCIDTHATKIQENSLEFLRLIKEIKLGEKCTISVERDDNFIFEEWVYDIEKINEVLNNG